MHIHRTVQKESSAINQSDKVIRNKSPRETSGKQTSDLRGAFLPLHEVDGVAHEVQTAHDLGQLPLHLVDNLSPDRAEDAALRTVCVVDAVAAQVYGRR